MKNTEYIKKFKLSESNPRFIDNVNNLKALVADFYLDFRSQLEVVTNMTTVRFNTIADQFFKKVEALDRKVPFGFPNYVYDQVEKFRDSLMEEFLPEYTQQLNFYSNEASLDELKAFLEAYDIHIYSFTGYGEINAKYINSGKYSYLVTLAVKRYKHLLDIKDRKEEDARWQQWKEQFDRENQKRREQFHKMMNLLFAHTVCPIDSYSALGLTVNATLDDVKSCYRKLSLQNHPDRGGNHDKFIELTEHKNKIVSYISSR